MKAIDIPFYISNSRKEAEQAVNKLNDFGFDEKKLSIVGKGFEHEERFIELKFDSALIKSWVFIGAFWGGMWSLIFSPSIYIISSVDFIISMGPVAVGLIGALVYATAMGCLAAIVATLWQIGLPTHVIIEYEIVFDADRYIFIARGGIEDAKQARELLFEKIERRLVPRDCVYL